MVSDKTIEEFKDAVKAEHGVALTTKEASEILLNWVGYFDLLAMLDHRSQIQTS